MSSYVITTDDNSDLPESFMEEHGIKCAYFSYFIDEVHYTHDNFLPVKEFYDRMRNGSLPTTAQVNPEDIREMMEPILKEGKDVLHIAFSSGLSGGYNSSRIAAEELREEYPDRTIIVIDSLAASLGQGLLVYYAQMKKEAGEDIQTVADWVETHKNNLVHLFTVDDLNHLHRGGRVSKATAIVGGMLNIKPVLHVDDEGHLIALGKVRGRKKSLLELVNLMEQKLGSYAQSCDTIFVSHGDCEEDARFVAQKVEEKYKIRTELINYVGATIGAHSGPGTVALFFLGDER
ncbi:MAG: DegV family protein [Blautia sp.]|nr:DegV family protein [Blautia sp.]MDY5030525.1 DegV family protein [Blautia sp.]